MLSVLQTEHGFQRQNLEHERSSMAMVVYSSSVTNTVIVIEAIRIVRRTVVTVIVEPAPN